MPAIRTKEKERARALRGRGKSVNQISQALGISKRSVSVWVRDIRLTASQKRRLRQRELEGARRGRGVINHMWVEYRKKHPKITKEPRWSHRKAESFFDVWTPEMAYVLGYFAADGCMFRNPRGSYYIAFYSTDWELIDTVKRLMDVTNKIETRTPNGRVWKRWYTIQIGSKKIFAKLVSLGFRSGKSCALEFPEVPDEFLPHFVRGFLDGDGCVYVGVCGNRRLFVVRFTSGTRTFLETLHRRLKAQGISGGSVFTRGPRHHVLSYSMRAARQLRKFMYPNSQVPCLERKRKKFYSFE